MIPLLALFWAPVATQKIRSRFVRKTHFLVGHAPTHSQLRCINEFLIFANLFNFPPHFAAFPPDLGSLSRKERSCMLLEEKYGRVLWEKLIFSLATPTSKHYK